MRPKFTQLLTGLLLSTVLYSTALWADSFTVEDIRIDGLTRLDLGTVLRSFPVEVGDVVDEYELAEATRRLFSTGYFNDIRLARDGNFLIVEVQERPALSQIAIEGNSVIETEVLMDGLGNLGLREGEVFQRATLERIRLELARMYAAQGRYGAWVDATIKDLPENRVGLTINIKEGQAASIQHINIVGNEVFTDEELKQQFDLKTPGLWSFFFKDDRYAREKLSGDLERLRTYYLNRGYINFNIESTQVSLTPDRQHVYITINIREGELYYFGDYEFAGDPRVPLEELQALVAIENGEVFSRKLMVNASEQLTSRLGKDGYLQANVNPIPDINEETNRVNLKFFIDPGRRMYVRRINFRGNSTSADEVLRREMRQMEAAWASSEQIEKSKSRLERLSYFSSVNVDTQPVPGTDDQVDLEYNVVEQLSGNLTASVGISQSSGLLLGLGIAQKNFLGTGKDVSVAINNSSTRTEYSFGYNDPYYTVDGVSRGFNLFYRQQDLEEDDVSDYNLDTFGGGINFGYPINEYQRLRFGIGYSNTSVELGNLDEIPTEIITFTEEEGTDYNQFPVSASWTDNRLNKGLLATEGYSQSVSMEVSAPGSDLSFYKLRYRGQRYFPLIEHDWILKFGTQLGYGDSFGSTSKLPFYKNFFSGGLTSVRGFKNNTLGPRGDNSDEDPLGGNVLVQGSAELIFPFPFVDDRSKLRSLVFLDMGTVFDTECDTSNPNCSGDIDLAELRSSVGVGFSWLTFIGPLSFTLAAPISEEDGDETESFQFALGRTF